MRIGVLVKEFGWLGTIIAAVATGIWAVATFLDNAKRDYVKDFNTKQVATFFLTAETVSNLVAEIDQTEWNKQGAKFWSLHYGDLVLFENPGIECAMTYFGAKLNAISFERRRELGPYAFAVSQELRKFVQELNQNEWRINLTTLTASKTELTPLLGMKGERLVADFNQAIKSKIDEKCKAIMTPPVDIAGAPQ